MVMLFCLPRLTPPFGLPLSGARRRNRFARTSNSCIASGDEGLDVFDEFCYSYALHPIDCRWWLAMAKRDEPICSR